MIFHCYFGFMGMRFQAKSNYIYCLDRSPPVAVAVFRERRLRRPADLKGVAVAAMLTWFLLRLEVFACLVSPPLLKPAQFFGSPSGAAISA